MDVAPVRGRGLKSAWQGNGPFFLGRPREGAWIEIGGKVELPMESFVAPVRGRGLKFFGYSLERG